MKQIPGQKQSTTCKKKIDLVLASCLNIYRYLQSMVAVKRKVNNALAISFQKQVAFQLNDDDDIRIALDQHS